MASLDAIVKSGRRVELVVTQPDRPAGRGRKLTPPPVKEYAQKAGLEVVQPSKMKSKDFLEQLRACDAHVFVVAAFGRLLPDSLLAIPKLTINVHASLLPRWRGASPIHRAILSGDPASGVSIMEIVKELDAGDVCHTAKTPIDPNETTGELEARLAPLGGKALLEALDLIHEGRAVFQPQDPKEVTFAPLLEKGEGRIEWDRPAQAIHNQIRGLNPWPGAFAFSQGKRIKFHRSQLTGEESQSQPGTIRIQSNQLWVACKDEWLSIESIQPEGKRSLTSEEFIRGHADFSRGSWDAP